MVTAVGQTVKRADATLLTDGYWAPARGQRTSARSILELGDGSRTWLAYRALRELGQPAEIVVAEDQPFSADPALPAPLRTLPAPAPRGARGRRQGPGPLAGPRRARPAAAARAG